MISPDAHKADDNATGAAAKIVPIMVHSNPIGKQANVFGPLLDRDGLKWFDLTSSLNNYSEKKSAEEVMRARLEQLNLIQM